MERKVNEKARDPMGGGRVGRSARGKHKSHSSSVEEQKKMEAREEEVHQKRNKIVVMYFGSSFGMYGKRDGRRKRRSLKGAARGGRGRHSSK